MTQYDRLAASFYFQNATSKPRSETSQAMKIDNTFLALSSHFGGVDLPDVCACTGDANDF